jgi:hypothetical protein
LRAPGESDTSNNIMVASANGGPPHYVIEKISTGQFHCNGICTMFDCYKICQHVVAFAESFDNLIKFCKWWKEHKFHPDVDSLALTGTRKGAAGKKGGIPKRS